MTKSPAVGQLRYFDLDFHSAHDAGVPESRSGPVDWPLGLLLLSAGASFFGAVIAMRLEAGYVMMLAFLTSTAAFVIAALLPVVYLRVAERDRPSL